MFETLKQFAFGVNFIEWEIILLQSSISILTDTDKSCVDLQHGVRQSDRLCPLLFDIALEPLAIAITEHPGIHAVKLTKWRNFFNLYADDLLICLSDPVVLVPNLLKLESHLVNYQVIQLTGTKVNLGLSVNNLCPFFLAFLSFELVTTHFTYLGLKTSNHLFKLNFLDMTEKLKANISSLKLLSLSLMDTWANFQDSYFLPKSSCIPALVFFKRLDSVILTFVGANKPPRISKSIWKTGAFAFLYSNTTTGLQIWGLPLIGSGI